MIATTTVELSGEGEESSVQRYQRIFGPRMGRILPGLCIGNRTASYTRDLLQQQHITAIVSLTTGPFAKWHSSTRSAGIPEERHKWVQCADSSTQDFLVFMADICDFIEQHAPPVLKVLTALPEPDAGALDEPTEPPDAVLVHCEMGKSRSSGIIVAYLMRKLHVSLEDALAFVKSQWKAAKPSENLTRQLQVWERTGYVVLEDDGTSKDEYQLFLDDRAKRLKEKGLTGDEPLAPVTLFE